MKAVGLNPSEVGGGVAIMLHAPADMPECQPLAAVMDPQRGYIISRWSPSLEERLAIAAGDDILLFVWGKGHPPVGLSTIHDEHD